MSSYFADTTLVVLGIVIGVPATLAITRLISTMLFGVSASDPFTVSARDITFRYGGQICSSQADQSDTL